MIHGFVDDCPASERLRRMEHWFELLQVVHPDSIAHVRARLLGVIEGLTADSPDPRQCNETDYRWWRRVASAYRQFEIEPNAEGKGDRLFAAVLKILAERKGYYDRIREYQAERGEAGHSDALKELQAVIDRRPKA